MNWIDTFHKVIPKQWARQQVFKLFKLKRKRDMISNPRANYLRKHIKTLRKPLELASKTEKNLPFARKVRDLKVFLGARTKLLDWFEYRAKVLSQHVAQQTFPQLVENCQSLSQQNKRLAIDNAKLNMLLSRFKGFNHSIVRDLRLYGGNTGK